MPAPRRTTKFLRPSLRLLRGERIVKDHWLQTINGQRRYEVRPDGTDRFSVSSTVEGVEAAQYIITGGALVHVAGPFRPKARYEGNGDYVPGHVWIICENCQWSGNPRLWHSRRLLLHDAMRHRCPEARDVAGYTVPYQQELEGTPDETV